MSVDVELAERRALVREVRRHMRDFPQLNTLIDGEESDDSDILCEINAILDDLQTRPPPIGPIWVKDAPRMLLIDGVVSRLLQSAALLLARNDLSFSSGNLTVQMPQVQMYLSMAQQRWMDYQQRAQAWKVARNAQDAVSSISGVSSTWALINRPSFYHYGSLTSPFE